MSKKKESPETRSPQKPPADDSGSFSELGSEMLPLLPLLKKSVEHMRVSNEFVKVTNKELIGLNRSVSRQIRLLWVLALGMVFLGVGILYALFEQRTLRDMLDTNARANFSNVEKLAELAAKLETTQRTAEDTKKAVEEQPKISVKPADTTDPTSKPMLVVESKNSTSGIVKKTPFTPTGVEIPFDKEKLKK